MSRALRTLIAASLPLVAQAGLAVTPSPTRASAEAALDSPAASRIIVHPGESIQAAVDAATRGTTIVVRPGTYREHVTITTDGITLVGHHATLVPPAHHPVSDCSFGDPATDGICAVGALSFPDPNGSPVVDDPVRNVTIRGFTVKGFAGTGIIYIGAVNPVIVGNRAVDNDGYGIARFLSSGGSIRRNRTRGSEEAGVYVGESPHADVVIAHNASFGNELFGFFLRDAANGKMIGNRSHGNCVGALVLDTGPGVAGRWEFRRNVISHNNAACQPDDEEGTPPLSGIGILIAGGRGDTIVRNVITRNVPSLDTPFAAGVAVINPDIPGADPTNNLVKANVILGNRPDLLTDGSGSDNVFVRNVCRSSVPDGLCHRRS